MDLYLPICESASGDSKTPLAIFIHGGSFLAGDKGETTITDLAKSFAKRGYAAASINYRMGFVNDDALNQCNFPNYSCFFAADSAEWYRAYYRSVQDGKGALRFLVNHATEYQIDPNNIFVSGESATRCLVHTT
jgi:acetyl esterase/lipase